MTDTAADGRPRVPANGGARPGVGPLLRAWRQQRRLSQLELALRADSSARHISFVETGRSVPSRAMVLRLAEHLDVPVGDRNALLMAAGYAPAFGETPLDAPAMAAVRDGLAHLLTASEPNPTLVLHGAFDIAMTNRAAHRLLVGIPEELRRPPLNVMRLALHPRGLAQRIVNLAEWREHQLERMRRTMLTRDSPALRALYAEVSAYPHPTLPADGVTQPADGVPEGGDPTRPLPLALTMRLLIEGQELSFLSTMTTFNTPLDVTVSELAIETFLPADPPTAQALTRLAADSEVAS